MKSAGRLAVFLVCYVLLIVTPQTTLSQDVNPDLQRGIADFRQENYEEALESLIKAREAEPDSSSAAYFLGVTYKHIQNYEEAEKHLKDAVNLSPRVKESLLELAEVYLQREKLEESLSVLAIAEEEGVRPGQTVFLKGLVQAEMGDNSAAEESFKNAKDINPELAQAADYQLGLLFLKEGDLSMAEGQFSDVIVKDPNTDMAVFAKQYKDAIERRMKEEKPIRYSLGFHLQYDDNVVLAPGDSSAAASISDDDDYREVLTFGLNYIPKRKGKWSANAQYSLYLSNHHSLEAYDVNSHTIVLVPSYKMSDTIMLNLVLSDNHIWVDNQQFLNTATVSPTYVNTITENQTIRTSLSFQNKEFMEDITDSDEDRDANKFGLDLSWIYLFPGDEGFFNLTYKLSKEDTDGKNWDNIENAGIATLLVPFLNNYVITVSGEIKHQDFQNAQTDTDTGDLKERRDTTYTFSSVLSYDLYRYADLQILYAYIRDDSNIALYDYDRNIISVGVEWDF